MNSKFTSKELQMLAQIYYWGVDKVDRDDAEHVSKALGIDLTELAHKALAFLEKQPMIWKLDNGSTLQFGATEEPTKKYDDYEVHPCSIDEILYRNVWGMSEIAENDPRISVWAVYGHLPGGFIQWICDCGDKGTAFQILKLFKPDEPVWGVNTPASITQLLSGAADLDWDEKSILDVLNDFITETCDMAEFTAYIRDEIEEQQQFMDDESTAGEVFKED
jgi:hypothetical protein